MQINFRTQRSKTRNKLARALPIHCIKQIKNVSKWHANEFISPSPQFSRPSPCAECKYVRGRGREREKLGEGIAQAKKTDRKLSPREKGGRGLYVAGGEGGGQLRACKFKARLYCLGRGRVRACSNTKSISVLEGRREARHDKRARSSELLLFCDSFRDPMKVLLREGQGRVLSNDQPLEIKGCNVIEQTWRFVWCVLIICLR